MGTTEERLQDAYELLRKTNEKLYTSMKAFQIAAEESGSLVFTYDTGTQTIFVDEQTAAAFGVAEVQPGVPYEMLKLGVVSEDTAQEYLRIHEDVIGGAKEAGGIEKLIQADGKEAVNELKFRAILDEQGRNTGTAVGVYRNITERYLRDAELERYEHMVLSSDQFTYQYDAAADTFTVFEPQEDQQEELKEYHYKDFRELLNSGEFCPERDIPVVWEVLTHGARKRVQVQFHSVRNGELRWFGMTGNVVTDPQTGEVLRAFGNVADLMEWKEQEENYRKTQKALEGMWADCVGIYDIDFEADWYEVLTYKENVGARMAPRGCYSQSVEWVARERVAEEYRKDYLAFAAIEPLRQALKKESRVEIEIQTLWENCPWQRNTYQVSEWQGDLPAKAILYQVDIGQTRTEQLKEQQAIRDAYEYAEAANAAKTDFLSRMSHDIRTPMNAIIGMTAIAAANLENPARVGECLGKINAASKHLLNLINEVLDMSKIESGTIELQNDAFNLADLMDNMVTMVLPQINDRNHELKVEIGRLVHENVIGDSLRLQQAFVNLISNAVKYTPNGGMIRVRVREIPTPTRGYGAYEFCFEDNGIGMSEEFQKVLFEPFSRAEDSRLSKVTGTGLGMTITRNLIRMMDGDIQVQSKLDEGTRFVVKVHLKLQDARQENLEELQDLPVLVVDDDMTACESTCVTLDAIGMKGEWCLSGHEAVSMVADRKERCEDYFAVLLDWKMPDMDGIATARAIREQVGSDVPIIFLTAYDWSEVEDEARSAGVDHFLTKPLFKSRLTSSFQDVLAKKREQQPGTEILVNPDVLLNPEGERSFEGRRLLLVEDYELNAVIARELLEMTGASVEWAENGAAAVDLVEKSEDGYYDMIFMDIQMPVMDGYQATAAIRSLSRKDVLQIPIVAMTANAFAEDVNQAMSAGMNEHISKPTDLKEMRMVMGKYLG